MNILRLIKIYELKGKVHPMEAAINDMLDGIEEVSREHYIKYTLDANSHFFYILKTNNIFSSYKLIHIIRKYVCSDDESNIILKYLLEKHLKLKINKVR